MFKTIKVSTLCLFGAIIVACAATPVTESTGQYLDSSAVTTKVKAKIMDKLGTQGFPIKVKTYRDEVQLSGFVDNATILQKAGEIAASVGDVKHVRNDLIVK